MNINYALRSLASTHQTKTDDKPVELSNNFKDVNDKQNTARTTELETLSQSILEMPDDKDKPTLDEALVTNTEYEAAFKQSPPDFSNMSLNDFHAIVKSVMAIDKEHENKFGSDEPIRIGKSGNPLISLKRAAMLELSATLVILSYGEGSIDPDEKIDVLSYFENRAIKDAELAKVKPQIYSEPARHGKELVGILNKYFSEHAFVEYKEKAITLLTDLTASREGVDKNIVDENDQVSKHINLYV